MNRKLRRCLIALTLLAPVWSARADYPSTVLSYNPLGYWRFDESSISPPLNDITNATALGSVIDGFCVADATKGQPGIVGNSVRFNNPGDAVGFCGSKIDVPYNAAINPNPPFSIEFWANPNSLGADSTGFCPLENIDPNFSAGSRAGWLFYLNNAGTWQFRLGNRSGYAGTNTATSGNAQIGVWQHIVATWDGTNANLYANGVNIGSAAISVTNWLDNTQSFLRFGGTPLIGNGAVAPYISFASNNGNRGYDGWLEEVAIYPRVLSPSTIYAHYNAATTNNAGYNAQILADNPAGYWPMNDAAVTAPDPGTFPVATNSGTLGSSADAKNYWGALAGQNGPGYAGFGAGDHAVFFDGDNGYCQVNDSPLLHFTGNITMAAWVKPTEQDFFRDIIEHGFDSNGAETFLRISRGAGYGDGNYYEVGSSDGTSYYDSVLFPIPPGDIGNWVFLAGTFDGTSWNLYRNGMLVGSVGTNTGDIGAIDVTNAWTIGSRGPDANFVGQEESFGGTIAEPAIFHYALLPADMAVLYAAAQIPITVSIQIGSVTNVILTWPASASGFTLQSATNLDSPVWISVSPAPVVVNGQNVVTNSISGIQVFYRLSHP